MKKTVAQVKFPSQFARFINNETQVEFEGESLSDFINKLDGAYGNIKERLFDADGQLHPYLNFFIGKKNIKSLRGMDSVIEEGACVSLLLSRAGG